VSWTCPSCARTFAREDQFHSHDTADVDTHFVQRPKQLRATFDELIASQVGSVVEVRGSSDVDDELRLWLRQAYELGSSGS
jgi:hypothetical protein